MRLALVGVLGVERLAVPIISLTINKNYKNCYDKIFYRAGVLARLGVHIKKRNHAFGYKL